MAGNNCVVKGIEKVTNGKTPSQLILIITCLGEWSGINSFYLGNFKIFKNHEGDLSQKSAEPNMWLLVNHTKTKSTLYWN